MDLYDYEHVSEPVVSEPVFYNRIFKNLLLGLGITFLSILMGTLGFYYFAGHSWIDSFHNSTMILSGRGPVVDIQNHAGKIFSSFYGLFSGIALFVIIGYILAPVIHRFLHKMHVDEPDLQSAV